MSKTPSTPSRRAVIDETIPDQLNMGNAEVATAVRNVILRDKVKPYVSRDVLSRLTAADRELLEIDLSVHNTGLKNTRFEKAVRKYEASGILDKFPAASRSIAALALFLKDDGFNVELMTTNREFANAWKAAGGNVAPDVANVKEVQGEKDYNRARQLLQLRRTLNVGANGQVLPTVAPPSANGPRTAGGARTTVKGPKPTAQQGEPVTAIPDRVHPRQATGDAKFSAGRIGFQGLNRVIQFINKWIQTNLLEDAWKSKEPTIRAKLTEQPELGALVRAHYSKRVKTAQENDSPMEHTEAFQYLEIGYGRTREEALDNLKTGPDHASPAGSGENYSVEWLWVPPETPVDYSKLKTPFPAMGLARFVFGSPELVKVKFKMLGGFDDRSVEKVKGGTRRARFLYLDPPNEITYVDQGKRRTKELSLSHARPGTTYSEELREAYSIPVVMLDSVVNPYDAAAAMVFPADTYTAELFEKTSGTDTGGLQVSDTAMFKLIRWIKPHKMDVLRDFIHEVSANNMESAAAQDESARLHIK